MLDNGLSRETRRQSGKGSMELAERIGMAEAGRAFWLELKEEYQMDAYCQVIAIPETDPTVRDIAMKYLPEFLRRKSAKQGVVLICEENHAGAFADTAARDSVSRDMMQKTDASEDEVSEDNSSKVTCKVKKSKGEAVAVRVRNCTRREMDALLQFYCLYEFASNLTIASLNVPPGRIGLGMAGHKRFTYEEVFAGVVYGILKE